MACWSRDRALTQCRLRLLGVNREGAGEQTDQVTPTGTQGVCARRGRYFVPAAPELPLSPWDLE